MSYLLDANVFIQAKNLYYGMDFCPAFWEWLQQESKAGKVRSIRHVFDELMAGDDELSDWTRRQGENFFREIDSSTLEELARVAQRLKGENYKESAINKFFEAADSYLVSHALAHRHTLVTHELAADTPRKVKIPNVCAGMGIECISPYVMLSREGAKFVLGRAHSGPKEPAGQALVV